jgi:hypothetical protein
MVPSANPETKRSISISRKDNTVQEMQAILSSFDPGDLQLIETGKDWLK